jgi:hypothetical protein
MRKIIAKRMKKKKEREKKAHQKVLIRRQSLRKSKDEEDKLNKKNKNVIKFQKDVDDLNKWADTIMDKLDKKTLIQIEKNYEILKGLEEEYESEIKNKQKLNEELESKGLFSLENKLNYLHNELVEEQKNEECNSTKKEVADISVCKAPLEEN